jgi:hypothetical protein
MHFRGFAIVALLASAQTAAAFGQQAVSSSPTKTPSGINLSFDAQHAQLSASGYAVSSQTSSIPGTTTVTGTINLTITINLVSRIGDDDRVPCGAIVIEGEVDLSTPVVDAGIETASNYATVDRRSRTATCRLSIPYEWTLVTDASATEGLLIGYAAASVDHDHWDTTRRSTIQLGGALPLPPTGTTISLAFTTTL